MIFFGFNTMRVVAAGIAKLLKNYLNDICKLISINFKAFPGA